MFDESVFSSMSMNTYSWITGKCDIHMYISRSHITHASVYANIFRIAVWRQIYRSHFPRLLEHIDKIYTLHFGIVSHILLKYSHVLTELWIFEFHRYVWVLSPTSWWHTSSSFAAYKRISSSLAVGSVCTSLRLSPQIHIMAC